MRLLRRGEAAELIGSKAVNLPMLVKVRTEKISARFTVTRRSAHLPAWPSGDAFEV